MKGKNAEDKNGHGTGVAGIVGAIPNNGLGIAGIHPHSRLIIYKFTDKDSVSGAQPAADLALLIKAAVDQGAEVINISIGSRLEYEVKANGRVGLPCLNPESDSCDGVIKQAIKYAEEHGVVIVAASGDEGKDMKYYPAAYSTIFSNVITVAATKADNTLAEYSSTGSHVTISAPGGDGSIQGKKKVCYTVDNVPGGVDDCIVTLGKNGGYAEKVGTSFAAPHVTGAIALMISANSNLTPSEIRDIIVDTATDFASPPSRYAGAGILNAKEAVLAAFQY